MEACVLTVDVEILTRDASKSSVREALVRGREARDPARSCRALRHREACSRHA